MSTKPHSLAKSSLILIFARVIVAISGILQAFILTRVLLKGEYGTYQQILTVVGFSTVLALGLPESVTFFIARASSLDERIRKQSAILTLGLLLCGVLIALAAAADSLFVAYFNKNEQLRGLGWCIGAILAGNIFQMLFQNTSVVTDHVRDAARFSISYSLGNIAVACSLFFYKYSIQMFIMLVAAYNLLMLALRVVTIARYYDYRLRPLFQIEAFREVLAYSIPICLSFAVGTASRYIDRAVIGFFYTDEQFAIYAAGAHELPYTLVTASIITVLMPRVIKNYNDGVIDQSISLWQKGMVASSYLIFFAIATNVLLSREIVTVLYSEKYVESAPFFVIYTFLLVSRITYWGMFLQAMKKPVLITLVSVFSLVSNVVLNIVLINLMKWIGTQYAADGFILGMRSDLFGMLGASLSAILTSYASVGMYTYLNSKYLKVKARSLLPLKKLGAVAGVNALAFALFAVLKIVLIDNVFRIDIGQDEPGSIFANSAARILLIGGLWAGGYALVFRNDLKRIAASLKQ